MTGLSESHLRKIESGSRRISIDVLYKLMNALEEDANTVLSVTIGLEEETNIKSAAIYEDSIDDAMSVLPMEQRMYLKGVFKFMIENM